MINTPGDKVDFDAVPDFARRYLETYYIDVHEDEPPIARFIREKCRMLPPGLPALEVGCGPTVHHALSIAPYVGSIDMADYLPGNLAAIRSWKDCGPDAFSWRPYTEMILREACIPPTEENIKGHENMLRSKILRLFTCDVTHAPPIAAIDPYPIVTTFYCAEEVGSTLKTWREVMRNISMMVAHNGLLILSALRGTDRYLLGDPKREHTWLPCAPVTEPELLACLKQLRYKPDTIDIRSVDTPHLVNLGIPGILIAAAQKQQEAPHALPSLYSKIQNLWQAVVVAIKRVFEMFRSSPP